MTRGAFQRALWTFGLVVVCLATARPASAGPADCPSDGIRFGVEPYEAASSVIPIFEKIGGEIAQKMVCRGQVGQGAERR